VIRELMLKVRVLLQKYLKGVKMLLHKRRQLQALKRKGRDRKPARTLRIK
jgi:hypothetical protein